MKTLSLIAVFFAAFLIFVGFDTRATAGVLSYAVIFLGALIAIFIAIIWTIAFFKEKKERESEFDDSDS